MLNKILEYANNERVKHLQPIDNLMVVSEFSMFSNEINCLYPNHNAHDRIVSEFCRWIDFCNANPFISFGAFDRSDLLKSIENSHNLQTALSERKVKSAIFKIGK